MSLIIGRKKLMVAQAVAKNATEYSSSMKLDRCNGNVAVLLKTTAGDITVTQQCSNDDITFYSPVDAAGAALGAVATNATVTTGKYISYSPVIAPYIRYKVVENNTAATVVDLEIVFQEES